ncbi:MAG: GDSL-type esterase/lipase family protein [Clostridiales bacterium]|nr:GDSL-type esterase/lipase family protein [Clostridiales bacterium]MDD6937183.1 GDSL-type esterase/lipase family protein [Clostridiales bacterium]MDY2962210.1 GDSL-type esterase/lipase family protein [Oscillospiraceae bacterium]
MKKMNRNSMYSLWSGAIIVCLVLAVFAVIFASASGNSGKAQTPVETAPVAESTPTPTALANPIVPSTSSAALAQTEDAGAAYVDQIFFLGDSSTALLKSESLLTGSDSGKQVWVPESSVLPLATLATTKYKSPVTGNNVPVSEIVEVNKPKYLVIFPGSDNANLLTEEQVKAAYSTLLAGIKEQSPDTKIICSSLTPIASNYAYEDVTNEIINKVNGWIASAAEAAGVKYLDAAAGLVGEDGFLSEAYQNGDGVHLSADGIKAWLDYLKTHAYP